MASPGGVEVARISARVVPDTSHMLADLKADLAEIEARVMLDIHASVDAAELTASAREAVEQAQLAAGHLDIKADVDTSQVHEAETALGNASKAASGFSSGLSGIASAAIILGPALIPLTAVLGGLAAALVTPLAVAGGGLTLFGVIAGLTISETQKQLKTISDLQKKLSGLTAGTKAYRDVAQQLVAAQAALTPAQKQFESALTGLKGAFDAIPKGIVLAPITQGLGLLATVLPLLTPILKAASTAISDILAEFDAAAKSQGFKDFIDAFAKQLGPDIKAFATIAGNAFQGLFGLFAAFGDALSGSVIGGLETLTGKFAEWGQTVGQSSGFKSFVKYLKQEAPIVEKTLGDIAGAVGLLVLAFAPIGGVVLQSIDSLAAALQKVPLQVLTGIAAALVAITAASKLLGPLASAFSFLVDLDPVVLAVLALAAAFVALYLNSKPLRDLLADLGDFFKTQLLPVIETAAQQVLPALQGAFDDISKSIKENKPFLETMGKLLLVFASAVVVTGILLVAGAIRLVGKYVALGINVWHLWADAILAVLRVLAGGFALFVKDVLAVFGAIVDGAAAAFGWLPHIGEKITHAQDAFHQFADNVTESFDSVEAGLKNMQDTIDGVHGPDPIKITVDDLNAVKHLHALQEYQIKDKSFTVTTNFIERTPGPGGGIGHPAETSPTPVPPPSGSGNGSSRSTSNTTNINIDKVEPQDVNAFYRDLQRRQRGRAGGGVNLVTAR